MVSCLNPYCELQFTEHSSDNNIIRRKAWFTHTEKYTFLIELFFILWEFDTRVPYLQIFYSSLFPSKSFYLFPILHHSLSASWPLPYCCHGNLSLSSLSERRLSSMYQPHVLACAWYTSILPESLDSLMDNFREMFNKTRTLFYYMGLELFRSEFPFDL